MAVAAAKCAKLYEEVGIRRDIRREKTLDGLPIGQDGGTRNVEPMRTQILVALALSPFFVAACSLSGPGDANDTTDEADPALQGHVASGTNVAPREAATTKSTATPPPKSTGPSFGFGASTTVTATAH